MEDDPLVALRDARSRFIAAFPSQCDSIQQLSVDGAAGPERPERAAARHLVHRSSGLAGTIGFPTLSTRAAELESLLSAHDSYDVQLARDMAQSMRDAFADDLAWPPEWSLDVPKAEAVHSLLVVEDDTDQRSIICAYLRSAGHEVHELGSGEGVVDRVRRQRPAAILLDVEMPGLDGFAVCRLLKADPALSSVPVMILTSRQALDDRMTGLTLGADEYLSKPVDARELLLRVQRLTARAAAASTAQPSDTLSYDVFVSAARTPLALGPAALALIRLPPGAAAGDAVKAFRHEVRRRDIIGRYDDGHLVLLLPGMSATSARDRVRVMLQGLIEAGHGGLVAGVAGATGGAAAGESTTRGTPTIEALVAEADEALAEARVHGELASLRTSRTRAQAAGSTGRVLLADDDPDVARIVDAHMRAEGFKTTLAFDGQQALDAIVRERPDVLVLDLMMPKMTGFDLLHRLRTMAYRPRVIVLSGRGREEDGTRAFDLGVGWRSTWRSAPSCCCWSRPECSRTGARTVWWRSAITGRS